MKYVISMVIAVFGFVYFNIAMPIREFKMARRIKAYRTAGLLLLLFAVPVLRAQTTDVSHTPYFTVDQNGHMTKHSDGDDALIFEWKAEYAQDTGSGYPVLDNAARFVWVNCGKLMILFGLFAAISILRSKVEGGRPYNEVLRDEAAERWAEEQSDDSIHNPFDSPEGMQPASQYVSVRSRS